MPMVIHNHQAGDGIDQSNAPHDQVDGDRHAHGGAHFLDHKPQAETVAYLFPDRTFGNIDKSLNCLATAS